MALVEQHSRNRQFLRKYTPLIRKHNSPKTLGDDVLKRIRDQSYNDSFPSNERNSMPAKTGPSNTILQPPKATELTKPRELTPARSSLQVHQLPSLTPTSTENESVDIPYLSPPSVSVPTQAPTSPTASSENVSSPAPRRSTRERRPPQRLIDTDWADRVKSSHKD